MNRQSNIPNIITCIRIALLIPFVFLVQTKSDRGYLIATVVLIVAVITDLLDGKLARKLNSVSEVGDALDLLADRLLAIVSLTWLLVAGGVSFYLGLAVICRELVAESIRSFAVRSGHSLPHNIFGQAKLVAIVASTVSALLGLAAFVPWNVAWRLADIALAVALASGVWSILLMLRRMSK